MVHRFCPISVSPFDIWTSYLQIMKWYDTMINLNMNVVSINYMSWFKDFCPFMVQWFCPIFKSPFDIWTSYLQTMKWYDTVFDLNMNIGHSDLYFMVQWFCFISRRSFDICTSYFQIMKWYDTTFDLNMIVSHCDLYFMVQWFCSIFESPFDIWTSYIQIMKWVWHNYSPQYQCKSLWPIFHGPVILLYISKIIWHMHIILSDYEMVWHNLWPQYYSKSLWPIFHGPVILLYISKTIWHMHIIFPDYKIVWHNLWPQYECKSLWPIFHGPVILPYIWKIIWQMNIILPDYKILWHNVWPQYECRSVWPIFYGPVILLYMWKTIWHINIILPDYEMVLHNIWPEYECWSVWPMFNGPVILLYIWKTPFDIWKSYCQIIKWCYTVFHLSMTVSHCDLYFMVQWFCPVSERYSTDLFTLSARHNSGELCCHATALVEWPLKTGLTVVSIPFRPLSLRLCRWIGFLLGWKDWSSLEEP